MALIITDFTYKMTLLITVIKKHVCNDTLSNVISEVLVKSIKVNNSVPFTSFKVFCKSLAGM
jgi:hypothetical protein